MLKLRATQLRPERELTQTGAELIGTDSLPAVIEILRIAVEALEVAGVTGITIDLTLPDLVETLAAGAMPLPADKIDAVRDMISGLVSVCTPTYLARSMTGIKLPRRLTMIRARRESARIM